MHRHKTCTAATLAVGAVATAGLLWSAHRRRRRRQQQTRWALQDLVDDDDDKKWVFDPLLDVEIGLYQREEPPITTLTWFRGDFRKARPILEGRLQKILDKNPWLGGRIFVKKDGDVQGIFKLYLAYRPSETLDQQNFMTTLDPKDSPISRETPLHCLAQKCERFMLKKGADQPFIKVSLVPCCNDPDHKFALIVAISHLAADGHTFYKIHGMLCSKDDESAIVALTNQRIATTGKQQSAAMGKVNYDFFAIPGPGFLLNLAWGFWRGKLPWGPRNESRIAMVDPAAMKTEKQLASTHQAAADDSGVPFVSTNDVLTSWFFQHSGCSLGVMSLNWRDRLKGHTGRHAGNYESGIFYYPEDSACPNHIRRSLANGLFRRTESNRPLPGFFQYITTTLAISTNWASFAEPNVIEGCEEDFHMPLYDAAPVTPTTFALMIIFRSGPQGIGTLLVGTPDKLQGLRNAPFLHTLNG